METGAAMFERGRLAYELGDPTIAELMFRRALDASPGNPAIEWALGAAILKQGRYSEGFPLFEAWRRVRGAKGGPNLPFPRWRGQAVNGRRVLIWGEQGFGDQIMMARFAKVLIADGGAVDWLCPPPLAPLLSSIGVGPLPNDRSVDLCGYDFYVPSGALPLGFDLSKGVPAEPYLSATPLSASARIGVMTEINTANLTGLSRALPDDLKARLRSPPLSASLAPEDTGARHFGDTARIVAGLDLVISADTSVAHLAGAMGKPVWILLPFNADWRWLVGRCDNPWYPSARLFRQAAPGSWLGVVEAIEAALADDGKGPRTVEGVDRISA